MGQAQNQLKQNLEYQLVKELPVGNIVKHNKTDRLHFLKQYSFTAQQAYQNALNMHSMKLANKYQHILNFLHFTTKSQNSFCSSFHKIILIFQYSEHTLEQEIINRSRNDKYFNQKQVWAILCSCILACVHLIHTQGKMHCAITTKDIRFNPNGSIKILSPQMIGIDSNHTQNQGTPKTLAITLIQCITMQKITNQDGKYLSKIIQSLECTRQMKQMLQSMIKINSSFLELQQHLFKLVQDDDSLASNSNTPILKSYSPLTGSGYKCPRIYNKNQALQAKNSLTSSKASCGQLQSYKLQPMPTDDEDTKSYIFTIDHDSLDNQIPDQNEQQSSNEKQIEQESSQREVNSFYLRQRKQTSNQQTTDLNYKNIDKMFISKNYENNQNQPSWQKQNNQNSTQNILKFVPKSSSEAILVSHNSNENENLFTDPKLFSIIKNDLEQIKMRRSIGDLAKFSSKKQISIPDHRDSLKVRNDKEIQNYTFLQQKNILIQKEENQAIKIQEVKQVQSWFNQALNKPPNLAGYKIQNNFIYSQKIKQEALPKQIRSQYCEDKKQNYSSKQSHKGTEQKTSQRPKSQVAMQQQKTNILNDTGIGFKKKKQSTGKFQNVKQISYQAPQTPIPEVQRKGKQNLQAIEQKYQQKSKTVGMKPQEVDKNLQSIKHQQFFNDYAPSQTSQPVSQQPSARTQKSISQNKIQKQSQTLVQVSEKYARGHYQGTKLNNRRHGFGTFFYSEGGKYVGNWRQNKMHGKGVLYYPNQKVAYDGEWQNDQLSGYGVLYNEEVSLLKTSFDYRDFTDAEEYWVKYQGHFYQDNKQGQGKLYLSNGQILEGQFHDDKVQGQGTLYKGDGTVFKGKWRQNKLIKIL